MSKRLSAEQWSTIRTFWESLTGDISLIAAATLAAQQLGFEPPTRQAVSLRAKADGWTRKQSRADINQNAHLMADRVSQTGADMVPKTDLPRQATALTAVGGALESGSKLDTSPQKKEIPLLAEDDDSVLAKAERKQAEIRARHRQEWLQVAQLKQEALALRRSDSAECFHRLKIAKITAEATEIQQRGECKSWGMDELIDPARLREMTEEELEAFIAGRC